MRAWEEPRGKGTTTGFSGSDPTLYPPGLPYSRLRGRHTKGYPASQTGARGQLPRPCLSHTPATWDSGRTSCAGAAAIIPALGRIRACCQRSAPAIAMEPNTRLSCLTSQCGRSRSRVIWAEIRGEYA